MENRLTAEQIEKLKACKTAEEAKAFAEKENIELTDEQLEAVAGGAAMPTLVCDPLASTTTPPPVDPLYDRLIK